LLLLLIFIEIHAPSDGSDPISGPEVFGGSIGIPLLGIVLFAIYAGIGAHLQRRAHFSFLRGALLAFAVPFGATLIPFITWLAVSAEPLLEFDTYSLWFSMAILSGLFLIPGALLQVVYLRHNYAMQRSSRVVTPLAGTSAGDDRLRSASGAPTARRR
jgi:hypothetical protein